MMVALASRASGKEVVDALDALGGTTTATTNTWTGDNTFQGLLTAGRIVQSVGTEAVGTDFALSSGFGTTATVAVSSGADDSRGTLTVTAGGLGFSPNPTITVNFKDGAWINPPVVVACRSGGDQPTVPVAALATSVSMTFTFLGTPADGEHYLLSYIVLG